MFYFRCKITECENGSDISYNPSWLSNAVPYESGSPAKCERYASYENYTSTNNCSEIDFNTQQILSCDSYIYRTEEVTIVQDVSIFKLFVLVVYMNPVEVFNSLISSQKHHVIK